MAVGLAIFFAWHSRHPDVSKDQALRWMLWMWLPLGAAMIVLLNLLPGCPRCHTRYGRLKMEQVPWSPDRYRARRELPEACPRCHVSFDEPWK